MGCIWVYHDEVHETMRVYDNLSHFMRIFPVHSYDFRPNVSSFFGWQKDPRNQSAQSNDFCFDPRNCGGDFRHLGTSHVHLPVANCGISSRKKGDILNILEMDLPPGYCTPQKKTDMEPENIFWEKEERDLQTTNFGDSNCLFFRGGIEKETKNQFKKSVGNHEMMKSKSWFWITLDRILGRSPGKWCPTLRLWDTLPEN